MGRLAILGNGALTIGLDQHGLVHDFYYPYVGLDNLTTSRSSRHKLGVWVDGTFTWTDDGTWDISVDFRDDALISHVSMTHQELGIHIQTEDFVHPRHDTFCRRFVVTSLLSGRREVRVFYHQIFEISRDGRADTAMYVPDGHYIFDYKGRVCLLISGSDQDGNGFDQYAVGNYGIEGKEGTFRDAEDGQLSGSAVEHGGVDSVIRFERTLTEGESYSIDYWIIAAKTQSHAESIHETIKAKGMQRQRDETLSYWINWLKTAQPKLASLTPSDRSLAQKSLLIIKAHTDKRGGIIASCDSSIYNYGRDYYSYVWPRDGAYAIWPLIRLGYKEEAKRFFEFCSSIVTEDGYLMHKYQPDGAVGSTWHPLIHNHHRELAIQEDETAIVVFMLGEYLRATGDKEFTLKHFQNFVVPAVDFMCDFVDEATGLPHASYDLWEEKFLTSTYTTALVYAALQTACDMSDKLDSAPDTIETWRKTTAMLRGNLASLFDTTAGSFKKGILLQHDGSLGFDDTLDVSSLFGVAMFAQEPEFEDMVRDMLRTVSTKLLNSSPSGGTPRYIYDQYFASDPPYCGNPWFVTTLWLAQVHLMLNEKEQAKVLIDWTRKHALSSGVLSEQVDPSDGTPKSVTPLVWSHAELINTLIDYNK